MDGWRQKVSSVGKIEIVSFRLKMCRGCCQLFNSCPLLLRGRRRLLSQSRVTVQCTSQLNGCALTEGSVGKEAKFVSQKEWTYWYGHHCTFHWNVLVSSLNLQFISLLHGFLSLYKKHASNNRTIGKDVWRTCFNHLVAAYFTVQKRSSNWQWLVLYYQEAGICKVKGQTEAVVAN